MTVPHIDTFEHDISEEIKNKEATVTDIASASGEVGNTPVPHLQTSRMLFVIGGICLFLVLGIFGALFFFYPQEEVASNTQQINTLPDVSNRLPAISPILSDALTGTIGEIKKSEYGYTMELISYSAVFSYMIKNESLYADELALAVGSSRDISTTTTPFIFNDVTLSNQNMRVGTSGSSTIVYAFINGTTLAISSSTAGILTLRSAILR